jgi:hypothetical protein
MLDYAMSLKDKFEAKGYKVKLTRDTNNTSTYTATNMYDEDGRISIACKTKAKYMISLHLNSDKDAGGLEVYAPCKSNLELATKLAGTIVSYTNISYSDYMTLKLETLHKLIGSGNDKEDQGGNSDIGGDVTYEVENYYIRADFNNWSNDDRYKMKSEDGGKTYTFTVSVENKNRLKVYHDDDKRWLGEESMDPECTVDYDTDSHGNIVLTRGEYKITYSVETGLIYIEKTE